MKLGTLIPEYKSYKNAKTNYTTYDYVINDNGLKISLGKKYYNSTTDEYFYVKMIDQEGNVYFYDTYKRWCYLKCNEII
jgi:hypothetical protein